MGRAPRLHRAERPQRRGVVYARGPREETPSRELKPRASGPEPGRSYRGADASEEASRTRTPPSPGWRGRGLWGEAGREAGRSPTGTGSQCNKCPRQLPNRLQACSRFARPGAAAPWPSLSRPLPHRTYSATRRSSAPVPSLSAPSSEHCRGPATAHNTQPTSAVREQLRRTRPLPRVAPSGDVTRVCKGFRPTPGRRLRSAGGLSVGSRAPPGGRLRPLKFDVP